MTCIVGIEGAGGVWLGADRFIGNGDWIAETLATPKIWSLDIGVAAGCCGDMRSVNVMRHRWKLPAFTPGANLDAWMFDAVEALRGAFAAAGAGWKDNDQSKVPGGNGAFLVAAHGALYVVGSSFSFWRSGSGYGAVGSGEGVALGSFATSEALAVGSEESVRLALGAAARHSPTVRAPFDVMLVSGSPS